MDLEALQWAQRGADAHERGDLSQAVQFYQKAIEIEVMIPGLLSNLGSVLTDLGEFLKAEAVFAEAVRLDAENPAVWCNRGNLHKKNSRWTQAIQGFLF